MADELQSLLERIQKDGVEKADVEAARILAEAKDRAAGLVKEAEASAAETRARGEREAGASEARGRRALEQAARDVILGVGEAVTRLLESTVGREVDRALTPAVLQDIVRTVVTSYVKAEGRQEGGAVLVNPAQEQALRAYFLSQLRQAAEAGMELRGDGEVLSGFRVSLRGGQVYHDFSGAAIAEALCRLLRPQLAEIVRSAQSRA